VRLPSGPTEAVHQTRGLAVIAYQQAAGLHERIAALYEQLGHPDRARQSGSGLLGRGRGPSEPSGTTRIRWPPHRAPDVEQWCRHPAWSLVVLREVMTEGRVKRIGQAAERLQRAAAGGVEGA
jgi:hypothetical protein